MIYKQDYDWEEKNTKIRNKITKNKNEKEQSKGVEIWSEPKKEMLTIYKHIMWILMRIKFLQMFAKFFHKICGLGNQYEILHKALEFLRRFLVISNLHT